MILEKPWFVHFVILILPEIKNVCFSVFNLDKRAHSSIALARLLVR